MAGNSRSGRKSEYSEVTARRICETIATGRSLSDVCREKWAPGRATVHRWESSHPDFAQAIEDARTIACDILAEECLSISDETVDDSAAASRQRTRIEARHWLISKIRPKKYGDKLAVDLNVKGDPREAERRANEKLTQADIRLDRLSKLESLRQIAAGLPDVRAREAFYLTYPEARPYVAEIEGTALRLPNTREPIAAEQHDKIFEEG